MNFDELKDPQLQARLKDAKTLEEVLGISKECGIELTDAQIEGISGGWSCDLCSDWP